LRFITILVLLGLILLFALMTNQDNTGRPCGDRYIVQSGDDLSSIAAKCGVTVEGILEWNPQIAGPGAVAAGTILRMPPADADATIVVVEPQTVATTPPEAAQPEVIVPQPGAGSTPLVPVTGSEGGLPMPTPLPGTQGPMLVPETGGTVYVVQQDDTLFSIAQDHGLNVDAILAANPQISDPDVIAAGQEIVIPPAE